MGSALCEILALNSYIKTPSIPAVISRLSFSKYLTKLTYLVCIGKHPK